MKINSRTIKRSFTRLKEKVVSDDITKKYKIEQPLKAELFSINQLEQYARLLAKTHEVDINPGKDKLLPRLSENEDILVHVYELLMLVIENKKRISTPAEWLIDNFYLVEEQIRTARQHFPKNYSRELPHLKKGPLEGFPRVYDIALKLISHSDGRVHGESLYNFVTAYQTEKVLKLGELWAIPIMIRLSLLENLRRVAVRIYAGIKDRDRANYWAGRMLKVAEENPKNLVLEIADLARSKPDMSSAFVSELVIRLQGQSTHLVLPLTWIEQRLSEDGTKIEQIVHAESQKQASDQVSIGNSINSLRLLNAIDWKEFVEKTSSVNAILQNDPIGVYVNMDFETRDHYRHVIEDIAKNSRFTENEVAVKAVELAAQNIKINGASDRMSHVGFYLIDKGLSSLEQITQKRFSGIEYLQKKARQYPLSVYLTAIFAVTAVFSAVVFKHISTYVINERLLLLTGVLLFICFSNLAIALVNWLITVLAKPGILPRMDFSKKIPGEERTLVVVPTIIYNQKNMDDLLEGLEIEYLANRDSNLHFSLLTDFPDAAEKTMPDDEKHLNYIREHIKELNEKYEQDRNDIFYIFHRPRVWNPKECVWMGYERKRGKIEELNAFLTGNGFRDVRTIIEGNNIDILKQVKYVITLDADTLMSLDSAQKLVGTIAHPLNKAVYDEKKQRVVDGYTIFQPRLAVNMVYANKSWFVKIFGGEPGIDPYTKVVSDVYQDYFYEGSFIGKGIYAVELFSKLLGNRFPENRILSHDLIEGCYARSALVNDVQFYEKYPSSYLSDVNRRHRWIRGDWQLLSWLKSNVPGPTAHKTKNPLSRLSQWKIFDNLRRSSIPASTLILFLVGCTVLSMPLLVTMIISGIIFIPNLLTITIDIIKKQEELSLKIHFNSIVDSITRRLSQALFAVISLPYEAFYSIHAILLTLIRMFITHKKMLEWDPSSNATKRVRNNLFDFIRAMWFAPAISSGCFIYFVYFHTGIINLYWIFLGLWFFSPAIAWWISKPLIVRKAALSTGQTLFLRKLSRKTWHFFETFVNPESKWLPPDNYQEKPVKKTAYRTSPTNIGLYLLANLSSFDFGYISAGHFIKRIKNAFDTASLLERYRNHFYNWYDLKSLEPLPPLYVSTVDSGNLAGYLLVLESGLNELPDKKIVSREIFRGLEDALYILIDLVKTSKFISKENDKKISIYFEKLRKNLKCDSIAIKDIYACLNSIKTTAREPDMLITAVRDEQVNLWYGMFKMQCDDLLDDLVSLAPWLLLENRLENILQKEESLKAIFEETPALDEVAELSIKLSPAISGMINKLSGLKEEAPGETMQRLTELNNAIIKGSEYAANRITVIKQLLLQCAEFADADFEFLYDKPHRLLCIGYNVSQRHKDNSYYDLLASEARLVSYISIAKRQLPVEHWFALGRMLTVAGGEPVLLSWGGSMFEYLMPLLVMPTYENSMLDATYKTVVNRQIKYGMQRGVPWGISESGYNNTDAQFNYQYSAFGVPELGVRPGLTENLVIAPYASVMALMVFPEKACENLQEMSGEGYEGRYGFYEAVDFTPSRLPHGLSKIIIQSFMTHHQGMALLSLAYLLLDRKMQKRFENNLIIKSADLLLQERIPKFISLHQHFPEMTENINTEGVREHIMRVFNAPNTPKPEVHLLSNGTYHVMVTNSGGGYSKWKNLAGTRWREDTTRDNWGTFCYIRDLTSKEIWSNTYQPTLKKTKYYEAIFSQSRAEFRRRDSDFETYTEVVVSPEDDIELRRVRLTNHSDTSKTIEFTTYAEVVLLNTVADELHPGFNNLFIQTEIIRLRQAILCTRRPGSEKEKPPFLFHLVNVYGVSPNKVSYETDRLKFIGRGRNIHNPQVINNSVELSNTEGFVLDPIVSIRCNVTIEPEQTITFDVISGVTEIREKAMGLIEKYKDRYLSDRVFALAWAYAQIVLQQLNLTEADAQLYASLASSILYANPLWRANAITLIKNARGQSDLWGYGISGDLPIVLLKISDSMNIELVRQLISAHAYWRRKGLVVDLMVLNEDHSVYRQQLHDQIMDMIAASSESHAVNNPGGVFIRRAEHMSDEDKILIQTVARIVITDTGGTLLEQIEHRSRLETAVIAFKPIKIHEETKKILPEEEPRQDLIFFNGIGGFTQDGREYVIITKPEQVTPLPWVNILANPNFGTVVSESGGAYTWSENSHEFRLTPWYNDPVSDTSGEAIYIRDEETGKFWSPTPLPVRGPLPYTSRHGFGYSIFEYKNYGINSALTVYVSINDPVKFAVLKIRNHSGRSRRLSITNYCELVLGSLRQNNSMHIITEIDPQSGAMLARNLFNTEFSKRVVFLDVNEQKRNLTGDRIEFLGRNGTLSDPLAMKRTKLSGKTGPGLDPCAAMQVQIELADEEDREIVFVFGSGKNIDEARNIIQRFRNSAYAHAELETVWDYWKHTLGTVYIETPDQSVNILINGWLLYQTLACRLFARSGYYQSSGAYGFRDQLQDVMAVTYAKPELVREHILRSAAHQFKEGDVQHWWHPPIDRGTRSHCSDDYLWLPLVVARYVAATGDTGILEEQINFIEGRQLKQEEESYYDKPVKSEERDTLYEHCVRAIRFGLKYGQHGLPLMGSGDWNDSMNLVGSQGKGESVWLGFFLYYVLIQFSVISKLRGDSNFEELCIIESNLLKKNIDAYGWKDNWYLRAYFDNGDPLGSAENSECQIDAISQSWSVLSGAGDLNKSRLAMDSLNNHLVDRKNSLILLLKPPFDKTPKEPGYIKGYAPGIRENGGQYTHSAIWAIMAFAKLGENQRAWELLSIINPINHGKTNKEILTYKVEPYVVAADIYTNPQHIGRGGWTWYTGSAGWMYQLIVESLIGLRVEIDKLRFVSPCLPEEWKSFKLHYRYRETFYHINIVITGMGNNVIKVLLDGTELENKEIILVDDHREHSAEVEIGT